ncbi:hypothetical protein HHK36_014139 [Tetracentron sinense]|uniref:Glycosyltransferases n=1 Tax=Tetracentron sinense TaxID=13715 RepID=A0A834ZBP4_TETSI|nr:hypothetical protein HHK36_014139 [Tetracentron sinense]
MASIRRTLSPVPRAGAMQNGEAYFAASPLSKSSSCTQNYSPSGGLLSSLFGSLDSHSVFYKTRTVALSIFTQRASRTSERSKSKGQIWRRAFFHFFICFMIGIFVGFTPLISTNLSINLVSKHQVFFFKVIPPAGNAHPYNGISRNGGPLNESPALNESASLETQVKKKQELSNGIFDDSPVTQSSNKDSEFVYRKLLIIVTSTYARPFQAYYLNLLAHALRLVPPPLLWIVVEMSSQSAETADILRRTGVMYRHLVFDKNLTSIRDTGVHQRNVALSHIETHQLDGIVYFADDDKMYSVNLFEQLREIRRFGTWPVAMLTESQNKVILEGPVCNESQVIGWHTNERIRTFRRFHTDMSGFAFNSTILWDPKRWHRSFLEPIRQLDTASPDRSELSVYPLGWDSQASTFIEQIVEDESQMEGPVKDCSRVMLWHLHLEASHPFYPRGWFMKKNLDVVVPLA